MNEAELRQALIVKELEKIKEEVVKMSYDCEITTIDRYRIEKLLDKHIAELKKGERINDG